MRRLLLLLGVLACGRVVAEPDADAAGGALNGGVAGAVNAGASSTARGGATTTANGGATNASGGTLGTLGAPEEASGANRNATPPEDTRPPRDGVIDASLFCNTQQGKMYSFGLRASQGTVYTLVSVTCGEDTGPCVGQGLQLTTWSPVERSWKTQLFDEQAPSPVSLGAVDAKGSEVLLGYSTNPFRTPDAVTLLTGNQLVALPRLGEHVGAAYAATDAIYLLSRQASGTAMYRLASGDLSEVRRFETQMTAVWAEADSIAIAGDDGQLVLEYFEKDVRFPQPGSPKVDFVSVWGAGGARAWAGTSDGRIAIVQGNQMTLLQTRSDHPVRLWGSGDAIFYATLSEFGQIVGDTLQPIVSDSTRLFYDMWGTSATELYLAAVDPLADAFRCGRLRVLHFNGSTLEEI